VRRACLAAVLLLIISAVAFLPFAGRLLVRDDRLVPADALFVLGGARAERWLEAVDVYRDHLAPLIVLSPEQREPAELLVLSRGVQFPSTAERGRDAILQLGVPASAVTILPGSLDSTAQEARALHEAASKHGWHRVIVVTSKYHSRRAGFAFDREFKGTGVTILVHTSRYDASNPARWWRYRDDVRDVVIELEKFAAYRAGLGG
jgi:uncharacterized SAM-binding protein YcdF (DUF218 family)